MILIPPQETERTAATAYNHILASKHVVGFQNDLGRIEMEN